MKTYLEQIMAAALINGCLVGMLFAASADYYVSPDGSDSYQGTLRK
ncbi:MAG: hypothetical protein GY809_33070, partial [Planctomycetes bacterium]|nr:hypothetical protein [Planctomycetota bacterium]